MNAGRELIWTSFSWETWKEGRICMDLESLTAEGYNIYNNALDGEGDYIERKEFLGVSNEQDIFG